MGTSNSKPAVKERRKHPRKHALSLVSFVEKNGEEDASAVIMGRTLNISAGGVRLESIEPIDVDTTLDMEIAFGNQVVSLLGTVIYCRQIGENRFGVGIRFQDTAEELPPLPE